MLKKYFYLFVISVIIYFIHASYTYQGVYGDGNGYYVYTQSIYFDHQLNSKKIYDHLTNFNGRNYIFSRIFWNQEKNPFTVGTGITWLPSMFLMSFFSNDRFDLTHELGPGLTGIFFMITGLYLLEKYLQNFVSKTTASWTIVIIYFSTSIFYYAAFEPALSHQPSFFLICFLLNWTLSLKKTKWNMFILGFLAGLLAIIRMADILLLIPIFFQAKIKLKDLPIILLGMFLSLTPQLYNQIIQYEGIINNPYLNGSNGSFNLSLLHLIEYLFSARRGLFLWSPILAIGLWGLIKNKRISFIISLGLIWLIGSAWSAYLSAGFGQRLAFSAIPYFAIGLAQILDKLTLKIIFIIFIIFTLWNVVLIKNFYLHKNIFVQNDSFEIKQFTRYMLLLK